MTHSRTFRVLFLGSLTAIGMVTVAVSGWLLWPEWRKFRAVENLSDAVRHPPKPMMALGFGGGWPVDPMYIWSDEVKKVDAVDAAVPRLLELLAHHDPDIRLRAVNSLREFGPLAKAASPQLVRMLSSEDRLGREAVAESLAVIGFGLESELAISILFDMMKHPVAKVPGNAIDALGAIGQPAVSFLIERLEGLDDTPHFVAMALGKIGKPAIQPLIEILKDPYRSDSWGASKALVYVGPPALPALHELLYHHDPEVRDIAANTIRNLESEARAWGRMK